jgi:DNA repair exonuclease SbcCD ATPase subunit
MADPDLAAIKARAGAATEGPWAWEATGDKDGFWAVGLVCDDEENYLSGELEHGQGVVVEGICDGISASFEDAEFIAHARSDIPALLAHVGRLASENHALRDEQAQAGRRWEQAREEASRLTQQLEEYEHLRPALATHPEAGPATRPAAVAERARDLLDVLSSLKREVVLLREQVAEYEGAIAWGTSCTSCARVLDAAIAGHQRAERAEAELGTAREQVEQFRETLNGLYQAALTKEQQPADDNSTSAEWEAAMQAATAILAPPLDGSVGS